MLACCLNVFPVWMSLTHLDVVLKFDFSACIDADVFEGLSYAIVRFSFLLERVDNGSFVYSTRSIRRYCTGKTIISTLNAHISIGERDKART